MEDKCYIGKISERLRQALKKPQGVLIEGDLNNHKGLEIKLKEIIEKTQPSLICTVGDEATKLCNKLSIPINLAIVDFKVGRKKVHRRLSDLGFLFLEMVFETPDKLLSTKNITKKPDKLIRNPPGYITASLVKNIKKAYQLLASGNYRQYIIRVVGEEDLAGVPAILFAPKNTLVLYGQPQKGLVVVEVTKEKKEEMRNLLKKYAV